jgi:hypothetical protein
LWSLAPLIWTMITPTRTLPNLIQLDGEVVSPVTALNFREGGDVSDVIVRLVKSSLGYSQPSRSLPPATARSLALLSAVGRPYRQEEKINCDFFQHRNLAVMMRPRTTCSCITLLCEPRARRYDIAIEAAFGENPISPW